MDLSVIVPTFNDAHTIGLTLRKLRKRLDSAGLRFEIALVDRGSTDPTRHVATPLSELVLLELAGTAGLLRNRGVAHTRGDVLLFMDADVHVTDAWLRHLGPVLADLAQRPRTITGSWVGIPDDAGWLERTWFGPREMRPRSHVGSGHLLVSRSFFEELGGFDERLDGGEDLDLCRRARAAGGRVVNRPPLRVAHYGLPRTLGDFLVREAWHGDDATRSLRAAGASRRGVAALLFVALHALAALGMVTVNPPLVTMAAAAIAGLCFLSAVGTYAHSGLGVVLANTFLYYAWYWGRAGSVMFGTQAQPAS